MQAQTRGLSHRLSAAKRREAILDAALPLFARDGFSRTSISAIAGATGVTKPVLYDHFDSKSELYVALLEREAGLLFSEQRVAFNSQRPLDERLRMGIEAVLYHVRRRPDAGRLLFRTPDGDDITRAAHEQLRSVAQQAGAAAILADPVFQAKAGLSRQSSAELLAELHGAVLEQTTRWALEHPSVSTAALVQVFVEVLWDGLAHQ